MLNSEEKRSLIDWCDRNPVRATAILRRCAAALVIVGSIALMGAETDPSGESNAMGLHAYRPLDASLTHAQALYVARQQQFMSSQSPASAKE
jgi:hypothetical protein